MYGYERVFLICWKKRKRKPIMKRMNRPTHETETTSSIITKNNPHSSISLLCYKTKESQSSSSSIPHSRHFPTTTITLPSKSIPPQQQPLQIPPLPNIHPQRRLLPNQKNLLIQPPLTLPPQLQIKIQQRRSQNQSHFIPSKILPRATSRTRTKRLKSLQMII